jgi:hypothetical protein
VSQPPYSLVQEGGELVGIDSVGLRPRVAQLGGFRIESKFSADSGVDIGFELDGEAVGWIEGGEADESLAVGFIGEWESHLESRHDR